MESTDGFEPGLLRLADEDNIAVATGDLAAGTEVRVAGATVTVARAVPTGHKVAIRLIRPGERIVKYGVPIGSATAAIAPGDYVHVHNVKSDFIATYTLTPPPLAGSSSVARQ